MTGHGYDDAILDVARGHSLAAAEEAALQAHLRECASCAALLVREQDLTAALRALGNATASGRPSAGLEARLLKSFATMHPQSVARRSRAWQSWVGVAAAAVILVAGIAFAWRGIWDVRRLNDQRRAASVEQSSRPGEFVPWPGAATLPAFESGQLVRTELPASVLSMLGIVPARDITGDSVAADVLVGQDGLARAVRLAQD